MATSSPSSSSASPTPPSSAPSFCARARPGFTSTRSTAGRRPGRSWRRFESPSPGRTTRRMSPPHSGRAESPPTLASMPNFEYNGHRISYDDYGAGDRPIVLVHGLLMNRRMYDRLAPEIAKRGNRVITIDLLGHGRSDRPAEMSQYSMTFFAQQVEALMDHLELDSAVVGGTSLGANVTLELAYLEPKRMRGMMIEMPVLDNALLAAAVIFTPIMVGLRFGAPILDVVASLARRIPRSNQLLDMGLDWIRQDPAAS